MKVSAAALKLCGSVLVGTLVLSLSDDGDKLGCIAAWLIYCCMSKENCCCNAGRQISDAEQIGHQCNSFSC